MFVFITHIVCYVCVYHTYNVLCLCLGFESCNNNNLDLGQFTHSTNFIYRKATDRKRNVIFNISRVGTVRESQGRYALFSHCQGLSGNLVRMSGNFAVLSGNGFFILDFFDILVFFLIA